MLMVIYVLYASIHLSVLIVTDLSASIHLSIMIATGLLATYICQRLLPLVSLLLTSFSDYCTGLSASV